MKIEVITRHEPPCVYCESAKGFLETRKHKYKETVVGKDITREQLLERFPTARTFPVVLVDDQPIGGFQQLKDYFLSAAVSGMSL